MFRSMSQYAMHRKYNIARLDFPTKLELSIRSLERDGLLALPELACRFPLAVHSSPIRAEDDLTSPRSTVSAYSEIGLVNGLLEQQYCMSLHLTMLRLDYFSCHVAPPMLCVDTSLLPPCAS